MRGLGQGRAPDMHTHIRARAYACTHTNAYCSLNTFSKGLQGVTRKRLQSKSATASLLIKSYQCMKEEIKHAFFLPRKADTLLKPAVGNRDALVLWRLTTCGWVQ